MKKIALLLVVGSLYFASGCDEKTGTGSGSKSAAGHGHAHEHPASGPHGGVYAEWGEEEYHVEFSPDHAKKMVTVYVLGEDVKTPKPIKASEITVTLKTTPPLTLKLAAAPLEGEKDGNSSRFEATHDELAKEQAFSGTISATVEGKKYSGDFEEKK